MMIVQNGVLAENQSDKSIGCVLSADDQLPDLSQDEPIESKAVESNAIDHTEEQSQKVIDSDVQMDEAEISKELKVEVMTEKYFGAFELLQQKPIGKSDIVLLKDFFPFMFCNFGAIPASSLFFYFCLSIQMKVTKEFLLLLMGFEPLICGERSDPSLNQCTAKDS